ncbi:MAG: hypothetical protein ABFD83_05800 [Armatimonadota bacterium]
MKGSKARFLIPIVIITVWVVILASTGRADTVSEPWPVWPEFHADMMHIGRNPHSNDLENPASLDVIWVFPRPDANYATEADTAIDDAAPEKGVSWFKTYYGLWNEATAEDAWDYSYVSDTAEDDYADNTETYSYHYLGAVSSSSTGKTDEAIWTFPYGDSNRPSVSLGYYYVYVWVPTVTITDTFTFTKNAIYTVYDDTGSTQVTFDQSDGGSWQLLTDKQFSFRDKTKTSNYKVVLSNVTGDTSVSGVRVAADAVKFVRGTGMEIYSSPVSATVKYDMVHDPSKTYDTTQQGYNGKSPVVYIGTVEQPLSNYKNAPETGAVYCVNSVTPINDTLANNPQYKELSERLGTAIWRYPSRVLAPGEEKPSWEPDRADFSVRDPLEGPVEGGFYSTPTLAHVLIGDEPTLVCFMTGCDRQIYALDATTGKLLWKGPGQTVGEQCSIGGGWKEITCRDDAFGGNIWYATSSTATTNWPFYGTLDSTRDGRGDGWSYSVYAWIPPVGYGETKARGKGEYSIDYENSSGSTTTATVTIDQSDQTNQGKWVQLGSSYFNVTNVKLEPVSSGRTVIADAVMVVPDSIGTFSYCSPVANIKKSLEDYDDTMTDTKDMIADTIYAVTESGRVLSFDADGGSDIITAKLCEVNWVYPKIRNKRLVSGSDDADADPLGSIGATPTYWDKSAPYLYVAALDGHIYCLDAMNNAMDDIARTKWTFFDQDKSGTSFGDSVSMGGFTSTPTIDDDNDQLLIGSTTGYFYCINALSGPDADGKPLWRYPDYGSTKTPLGAFRYSTTVVGDASDGRAVSTIMHRAWIGSTDGHVYSFNAGTDAGISADNRRLYVDYPDTNDTSKRNVYGADYTELPLLSPIQGSVAFDAAAPSSDPTYYTRSSDGSKVPINNTMTMYAGDMEGKLHWLSANSGRSDWRYDSDNPNATQAQLYIDKNNKKGKNYQYMQTMGELFSSPNVTQFKYETSSNPTSYVYVGCSDGRVYAFSDYGGAWGGSWAGGDYWPFPDDTIKSEGVESDPEVQCEIFNSDFFQNSANKNPQTSIASATAPATYDTPSNTSTAWVDWPTKKWMVSPDMKWITNVPTSTGAAFDADVDAKLLTAAKAQRVYYFGDEDIRTKDKPVYFEWGETINIILWNLPAKTYLKSRGSSAFTLSMTNSSGGASAGSIKTTKHFTVKEYNVLDGSGGGTTAPLLKYSSGTPVKRTYAYLDLKINYTKVNGDDPPSPGPGWILKVMVTSRDSTAKGAAFTTKTYPIARLIAGTPPKPFVADEVFQEQDIGVNNPLAIMDDQSTPLSIAWPDKSGTTTDFRTTSNAAWSNSEHKSRYDPEAHFNGNATLDTTGSTATYTSGVLPEVNLQGVNHGTTSRQARLWVMDRSATGTIQSKSGIWNALPNFRINADQLGWNGGIDAIRPSGGVKFPWEFGIGSADYPNISKQHQSYQKARDGGDPANNNTSLAGVYEASGIAPLSYDDCTLLPEAVLVSVDVPRFQPANSISGYSKRVEAYIDSNGKGSWDDGNVTNGKPSTYQEAYRRFRVGVFVPPDPKIEVEQQTIDIGRAPHGLGVGLTNAQAFSAYNPNPDVSQWFKTVTIKNAGNVNIPDMYIGRQVRLFSDQSGSVSPVPYGCITSSLDLSGPSAFDVFRKDPFITTDSSSVNMAGPVLGYTLTKSVVGDPDPSIMTIPDKRKWDMNYYDKNTSLYTKDYTKGVLTSLNKTFGTSLDTDEPLPVKVSLEVPLTQPIGAYHSYDTAYGLPYVPVFADRNRNGYLDPVAEPVAETSFQLNASVRENQLTGGVTTLTLPQIDSDSTPRIGDSTPAAFRDPASGNVYLFWSSNRMFDSSLYPDWSSTTDPKRTDFANAPWFIDRAKLSWDSGKWQSAQTTPKNQWWKVPTSDSDATLPPKSKQWPVDMSTPMMWTLDGSATDFYSVRHHSPVITSKLTSNSVTGYDSSGSSSSGSSSSGWPTWLVWAGDADVESSANKVTQDHLIFYTNVTGGDVTSSDTTINYIKHDPSMIKRSPSMAVYNDRAWLFWQGGSNGKLSLMYSTNDTGGLSMDGWTDDSMLAVPSCLSSMSSPNCIFRRFWGDLNTSPNYSGCKQLLDIVYAGTNKFSQNSDILLGRYIAANQIDINNQTDATVKEALENALPSKVAQPMPRVFNEQLRRDPKYGFYLSQHLAWVKPSPESPVTDSWGTDAYYGSTPEVPYIHVVFPEKYVLKLPSGDVTVGSGGAVVSATDGSVKINGTEVAPQALVPTYDEATGIYTYEYPSAITTAILGKMLVDFSGGVVRFTQPLTEVKAGDSFITPEVRADYTPQTWRLTTDEAVDNSPRAFIERTNMNTTINPGMGDFSGSSAPVDRLWVFWRKAGTGVKTSTIYYKTYRVGVDLTKLIDPATGESYPPIPMVTQRNVLGTAVGSVNPSASLSVGNNRGPWEVNRAGTKIYFSEVDERYESLKRMSGTLFDTPPPDITITYTPSASSGTGSQITVTPKDVYWIEETPEQSLFGFSADGNVNEDSIYAFADPVYSNSSGTLVPAISSKIWVFWTSTRSGTSDLFWETVSPSFAAD